MFRMMMILHSVIATTLMGMGITTVLAAGMAGSRPIIIAAAIGFVISLPVSWLVARQITQIQTRKHAS